MTIQYLKDINGHSTVSIGISSFMYFSDTLEKNTCVLETPREVRLAIFRFLKNDGAKAFISFDAEKNTLALTVNVIISRETCIAILSEVDHKKLQSKVVVTLLVEGGTDPTSVPRVDVETTVQLSLVSRITKNGPVPVLAPAVFLPHARTP